MAWFISSMVTILRIEILKICHCDVYLFEESANETKIKLNHEVKL